MPLSIVLRRFDGLGPRVGVTPQQRMVGLDLQGAGPSYSTNLIRLASAACPASCPSARWKRGRPPTSFGGSHRALWAPTQGDPLNWDASIGLPNHRYFVFEYKAVEDENPYPYVELDIDQLKTYQDLNDAVGDTVVWYVLPCWTGPNVSGTFLPAVARLRTLRSGDPRPVGSAPAPPGVPPNLPLTRGVRPRPWLRVLLYVADPTTMLTSGRFRTNVKTASLRRTCPQRQEG